MNLLTDRAHQQRKQEKLKRILGRIQRSKFINAKDWGLKGERQWPRPELGTAG
jgi:hypothetical protein